MQNENPAPVKFAWIPFKKSLSKEEFSWVLYDWASQSYVMIVMTVIMSMFFVEATNRAGVDNASVYWSFTTSASMIVIGILAPIIGTLSGYKGKKKMLFTLFMVLGLVGTFGKAFIPEAWWPVMLAVYFVSSVGYAGNTKVYDTFLVDVTDNKRMNWVSSLGFAFGYIGGAIPFIISLPLVVLVLLGVIDMDIMIAYRVAFGIATVWWLIFMRPFMKNVQQKIGTDVEPQYVRKSFIRIWTTAKEIAQQKSILIFLIAFFLYSDGVGTIIRMAVIFGAEIGIDEMTLLIVLLVTQFVAMPFAVLYGKLSQKYGAKFMIYVAIGTYCVVCGIALFMSPTRSDAQLRALFWGLAMLIGTAQGGIQALSRSYFARIIPKEKSNEYFGFYNVCSRFASMIGTAMFGVIAMITGYSHYGIAGVAVLFIVSAMIFKFVPNDRTLLTEESS
ncbi:MAG: MFS transporter [Defluviitaleaceae bacterium]|nr:MFS transporter [Defluviitaleaceae bacterium]